MSPVLGDRFGLRIEELGLISLKNIARPVEAFVLRLDRLDAAPDRAPGIVGFASVARPDKPSLAVLPFTNMSADPDQTYFSDGIAEDIITELSRSRSLLVIARNSSFTYQGRSVDIRQRLVGALRIIEERTLDGLVMDHLINPDREPFVTFEEGDSKRLHQSIDGTVVAILNSPRQGTCRNLFPQDEA